MIRLTIDGRAVEVTKGATILDAARRLGISIPTMCFCEGFPPQTSCMVCVVKVDGLRRLVPSCAYPAHEGMVVRSEVAEVAEARRTALELLLSEHVGDCDGPCRRVCPAHMNIPLMIRQIASGDLEAAIRTVKEDIALPAILGRVCPAPCERGCRRMQLDKPLAICLLKRIAADVDLAQPQPYQAAIPAATGKKVAILGGGPTGLSAAYYLVRQGHACTVFEQEAAMGGALRSAIAEDRLPREVIDAEAGHIEGLGVVFRRSTTVGEGYPVARLMDDFDAVVVAVGKGGWAALASRLELKTDARGIVVNRDTFETSRCGVFAGGAAAGGPAQLAVRSCGDGKDLAVSVGQYLSKQPVTGLADRFNSVIGKLKDDEKSVFMRCGDVRPRVEPALGASAGLALAEARAEAGRCLHCDCRKPLSCKLRVCSGALGAVQSRHKPAERRSFVQNAEHPEILFEQGKCILCGLCIEAARAKEEPIGLGFARRGIATEIAVPFGETLDRALGVAARECVAVCPTGALAFRNVEEPQCLKR